MALAKVSVNAAIDPVSFQLDMGYGSVGTIINNAGGAAQTGNNFLLEQAFGEIALPGNLTIDFGKFVTTAGAEVIEANKNWLYSRSLLFNAIPLVHTGIRANLKVNDQLTLQASVVNGWNNDPDLNAWKTIGVSASITVNPMISIIPTIYFGKEADETGATTTPGDLRFLGDLVVAATINDKFGLNLNFDYIKAPPLAAPLPSDDGDVYQIGVALMGRYVVAEHLNLAARGEFFETHSSIGGVSNSVKQEEVTVMAGIPVGKNFELRPEVRGDFSGTDVFAGGTKKNDFTAEAAALTYF